jgi:hypothetical protein
METQVTVLSPHPDDAVLSCWHLLTGPSDVAVINVFAGLPDSDTEAPWWDVLTGATDPLARMVERIEEDREALGLARCVATYLDFLDEQYRSEAQAVEPLVESLREHLEPGSLVYAPAAFSVTRDHALVRSAALALRGLGFDVSLYADLPHAAQFGWPSWVDGSVASPFLDVDAYWEACVEGPEGAGELSRDVHVLDPGALERKMEAVLTYRTQVPALEAQFQRAMTPESLRHEVVWHPPTGNREGARTGAAAAGSSSQREEAGSG